MRYRWWDAARVNAFIACKEMECEKKKGKERWPVKSRDLHSIFIVRFIIFRQLYTLFPEAKLTNHAVPDWV